MCFLIFYDIWGEVMFLLDQSIGECLMHAYEKLHMGRKI
jgi:hypothetical protein